MTVPAIAAVVLLFVVIAALSSDDGEGTDHIRAIETLRHEVDKKNDLLAAVTPAPAPDPPPAPIADPAPSEPSPVPSVIDEPPADQTKAGDVASVPALAEAEEPMTSSSARPRRPFRPASASSEPSSETQHADNSPGDPLTAILTGSDPSSSKLPVGLSREVVQQGMNKVAKQARRCSKKEDRPVYVSVTISKTGKVVKAVPTGIFAGTEVGNCVAEVARTASFPRSLKQTTVKYPFHP